MSVPSLQFCKCGPYTRVKTEAVICNLFSCVLVICSYYHYFPLVLVHWCCTVCIGDTEHKIGQCVTTISFSVLSHHPSVPTYIFLSFAT